jgi:hypothetical protein
MAVKRKAAATATAAVGRAPKRASKTKAKPVAAKSSKTASVAPKTSRVPSSSPLIARLRAICMALPEAHERPSHGEPTWFAGKGKSFATLDNHHHGAEHLAVWLPQPLGVQQMLIESDPQRFFRPPYVGVSGWIGVVLDGKPHWDAVASLVRDAYLHVATRKLAKQLNER